MSSERTSVYLSEDKAIEGEEMEIQISVYNEAPSSEASGAAGKSTRGAAVVAKPVLVNSQKQRLTRQTDGQWLENVMGLAKPEWRRD
ncbi:hypothetical protein Pcinc_021245 [Petrolisthes cinctipes]|uniref:Uncharacterized protein n=1 Tax=Petrolisthes cinctipes TaxID=88211 RepID=A0AAE1FGB6_PETCI|nr:hypothetical protein Pcinc_021245 [Petrolisthes cinctipes]